MGYLHFRNFSICRISIITIIEFRIVELAPATPAIHAVAAILTSCNSVFISAKGRQLLLRIHCACAIAGSQFPLVTPLFGLNRTDLTRVAKPHFAYLFI